MRGPIRFVFIVIAWLLHPPAAGADHMNAMLTGVDRMAGVMLVLEQGGRGLTGSFSGTMTGTLSATTDGGDNASGTLFLDGVGEYAFTGRWSQQGFEISVEGAGAEGELFFAAGVAAPPPSPGAAQVLYFLVVHGQTIGPFTHEVISDRLADGSTSRQDLIWHDGLDGWVRVDSLAEFAPPEVPPPDDEPEPASPPMVPPPVQHSAPVEPPAGGEAPAQSRNPLRIPGSAGNE